MVTKKVTTVIKNHKTKLRRAARKRKLRIPLGFPMQQLVRLRYVTNISLNPAIGGLAAYYFSANGMYDPDRSFGGHQPLYFDQYMAGYNHYKVLGSKIKVTQTPWGSNTSNNIPGIFGVLIDDDADLNYANSSQIIESNQGAYHWRTYSNAILGANTGGKHPSIERKFSTKKFFNRKKSAGLTDDLRGSPSSNPQEEAFYVVWASDIASNDPTATNFMVELEYIALLEEPKFVAQS